MKNMKVPVLCLIVAMGLVFASKLEASSRDKKLIRLIRKQEKAILKIIANSKRKRPELYWKLMTLRAERYVIIHKAENKKFLSIPPDIVRKKGKKPFFKKSYKAYRNVKKVGLLTMRKWPKFKLGPEIYYTLAVMTIENNNKEEIDKEVGTYLKRGLALSQPKSSSYKKLVLKACEHFYAQKNYPQAIKYYKKSLRFKKDKWYTKRLFNLSWSLMALEKYSEARKYLRRSFILSKKKKGQYVDYSEQILEYLPTFIDENNIKKSMADLSIVLRSETEKNIDKTINRSKEIGKYKLTDYLFNYFITSFIEKGKQDQAFDMMMDRLDFYLEIKKHKKFKKYSRSMASSKNVKLMGEDRKKEVTERVKRHIRVLQDKGSDRDKAHVLFHFNTLKMLDPDNASLYVFLQGEHLYSQNNYKKALTYYKSALGKSIDQDPMNHELLKRVFDSMLKSVEEESTFKKTKQKKWYTYIYKKHLSLYPSNNARSRKIYPKLFNIYYKEKKYAKSEHVLKLFIEHFPHNSSTGKEDMKSQQFMASQLFDRYVEKKDTKKAKALLVKLKGKQFTFEQKYLQRASTILDDIVFKAIGKLSKEEDQIDQYKEFYEKEEAGRLVKVDSAYFLSKIYLAKGDLENTVIWMKKTLNISLEKERLKRQHDVLEAVLKMVFLQDFKSAKDLAQFYFEKNCDHQYELEKDFYNASVLYALVERENDNAIRNYEWGKKCKIGAPIQLANLKLMIKSFLDYGHYQSFGKLQSNFGKTEEALPLFADALVNVYWGSVVANSQRKQNFAISHLSKEEFSTQEKVEAVLGFHKFKEEMIKKDQKEWNLYDEEKVFDEAVFNKNLEASMTELNDFKNVVEQYINTGYPQAIIFGNRILKKYYEGLGQALASVNPKGTDEHYRETFVNQMKVFSKQLIVEAKKREDQIKKIISENSVLLPLEESTHDGIVPIHLVSSEK